MKILLVAASVCMLRILAPAQESESAQEASGRQTFQANCSFCHGATAQGGAQGGPNLTQSALVRGDHGGRELGAFLKVGRPDKGMPAFNLAPSKIEEIAAFLHARVRASRQEPSFGNEVLVGNAAAGKVFFEGSGRCSDCHSATGNLQGIGGKYSPAVLQGRLVLPVGDGGYPGFGPPAKPYIRVAVREPNGRTISGLLIFLSDYFVTVKDATGERHTIARYGDVPTIEIHDPLRAHLELEATITDQQMHDLNAYLSSLK